MNGNRQQLAQQLISRGSEAVREQPGLAQRWISQGLQLWPDCGTGWFNLGLALHQQKRIHACIRAYRRALACGGDRTLEISATTNLAQDLLLSGAFAEGWQLYEQRFERRKSDFSAYWQLFGAPWQGWEDERPCRRLVVVGEQGLGDTLQFVRLLQPLQERGLTTLYFGPEALRPLLEEGSALGPFAAMLQGQQGADTLWCPLMSLPQRLQLKAETIPLAHGYLRADPERVAHWKRILQRRPQHRLIALHWQGNPRFERSLYTQGRSMPLATLQGLGGVEGVEYVSIQKGSAAAELARDNQIPLVEGQAALDASMDFRDTAAVLAGCDLLISADSSVVHLAGAMGVPAWVALSWVPEWRWGLAGETTPWYSSAKLFRQDKAGDWRGVVQRMRRELVSVAWAA